MVLVHHNELPILLFRTLTLILHHTPHLQEIVLLDDFSEIDIKVRSKDILVRRLRK